MKTNIDVELHSIPLPENFPAKLQWPRSSRPSEVTPAQCPAPAPRPSAPRPIPVIELRAGQLSSEQVEWLVEDFAERLRASANVPTPLTIEENVSPCTELQLSLKTLQRLIESNGLQVTGQSAIQTAINLISEYLDNGVFK